MIASLLAIYVCLKWYHFPVIRGKAERVDGELRRMSYLRKQCLLRLVIMLACVMLDMLIYQYAAYEGGLYLALMVAVGMIFVTPTKRQLDSDYANIYSNTSSRS